MATPHQFSDAEESDGESDHHGPIDPEEEEVFDGEDEDDDGEWMDDFDWETQGTVGAGSGGDFTKRLYATAGGQNPAGRGGGGARQPVSADAMDQRFAGRVYLGDIRDIRSLSGVSGATHSAAQSAVDSERRADATRRTEVDRANRATTEQVLDPRTRLMLYKLLNRAYFQSIHGCVSTGKEANVYYAVAGDAADAGAGAELAVKVFKTSILVFKDRDRYVSGEYRFRRGYDRHNPRKMVRMWAEKEFRNLHRLAAAGIPCPRPWLVKGHVLVMEFVGVDGWPAPRLKTAEFDDETRDKLYLQIVRIMRRMYHVCHLVHADLSEYNVLFHDDGAVVIDVSQSVEHDHPHALDFLRSDCQNVTEFFSRRGVRNPLTTRQLFDFVADITMSEEQAEQWIAGGLATSLSEAPAPISAEEEVDAAVFRQAFIPRTLGDVQFFERHAMRAQQGDTANVFYQSVTGMRSDLTGAVEDGEDEEGAEEEEEEGEEDVEGEEGEEEVGEDEEEEDAEAGPGVDTSRGGTFLRTANGDVVDLLSLSREERKRLVKEAKTERRKVKVPKATKKAAKKKAAQRGKKK